MTSSVYRIWKILHILVNMLFSFFLTCDQKNVKSHVFLDFQKKTKKMFSRTMCHITKHAKRRATTATKLYIKNSVTKSILAVLKIIHYFR